MGNEQSKVPIRGLFFPASESCLDRIKDLIKEHFPELEGKLEDDRFLWGEGPIKIGPEGERGHMAAEKEIYFEDGPPADF